MSDYFLSDYLVRTRNTTNIYQFENCLLSTVTYIILDISIRRLKEDGTVDIKETFNKVRFVRPYSSREPDQYVFCHFALIEYAESNGILKTSGFNWLKK